MSNLQKNTAIVVALVGVFLTIACQPGKNTVPMTTAAVTTPPPPGLCKIRAVTKTSEDTYSVTVSGYDGYLGGMKMQEYIAGPVPIKASLGQEVDQQVTVARAPDGAEHFDCVIKFKAQ